MSEHLSTETLSVSADQWLARCRYRVRDSRKRLLQEGTSILADTELLSLLLSVDSFRCANDLARDLMVRFGSLRALCTADREATRTVGMTDASYARLQAALELSRRHYAELSLMGGNVLDDPYATREYLIRRLRDLPYEVFCCVFLDARLRAIGFAELFRGSINDCSISTREIARECMARNAVNVIVAHNHPSGVAEPSLCDKAITVRIKQALAVLDIRLLDHFIIGDGVCESFADRGLL